jgi:hypothetical protein
MGQPATINLIEGDLKVRRNGHRSRRNGAEHVQADSADARYAAALKLVQTIDNNLRKGTQHYYDTRGRLLSSLDEVIHAMLTDTLSMNGREESRQWTPISELAA